MQRKLAAILSADVAAYGALMQADEAGTLERLKANRQRIFDPLVAAHAGRTFKLMGDGALAEFPSVIAAVECAMAIQEATEKAADAEPEGSRIRYRVGINLGEVIVDGGDIYGEGVNAAVRLQTLAQVGGVSLSRVVKDQIEGKLALAFEDLGEHQVKEHDRPVQAFAARAAAAPARGAPADKSAQPRVAICVLPFANMSGESEQEYFSDGISEDIITDLSKVSALWVAARNTSFQFKGKHVDVPQLARQLKVTHVLEGSVRKAGGRVRITAQLIDASGGHVWAERYDRDLSDIFALQDEISEAIVKVLKIKLLPEEKSAIERRATTSSEAYELFLMAREFQRKGSERLKPVIVRICRRVVELDPDFARGWALMSLAESEISQRGVEGYSNASARAAAERAIAADPGLAEAHAALAEAMLRGLLEDEPVEHVLETALRLDPNCYEAHTIAGAAAIGQRRYADAVRHLERAMELDADAYWPAGMVVQAYEALGDRDSILAAERRSLARCEKILAQEPDHSGALGFFVSALAGLGQADRAREWAKRAILFDPDNARLHYNLACAMASLNDADAAVDLIEPWIDKISRGWLLWMGKDNSLDPIREHPRFAALMARGARRFAADGD